MSDIVKIDPNLWGVIASSMSNGVALPFVQEIFLLETRIAGTSHLNLKETAANLQIDDLLIFKREPDNQFDDLAIMILTKDGQKLGYVPQSDNTIIARLMDAGKIVFGKIVSKELVKTWLKTEIRIYMRDM